MGQREVKIVIKKRISTLAHWVCVKRLFIWKRVQRFAEEEILFIKWGIFILRDMRRGEKKGFFLKAKKLELVWRGAKAEEQQRKERRKRKHLCGLCLWVQIRIIICFFFLFFSFVFVFSVATNSYTPFYETEIYLHAERKRQIGA